MLQGLSMRRRVNTHMTLLAHTQAAPKCILSWFAGTDGGSDGINLPSPNTVYPIEAPSMPANQRTMPFGAAFDAVLSNPPGLPDSLTGPVQQTRPEQARCSRCSLHGSPRGVRPTICPQTSATTAGHPSSCCCCQHHCCWLLAWHTRCAFQSGGMIRPNDSLSDGGGILAASWVLLLLPLLLLLLLRSLSHNASKDAYKLLRQERQRSSSSCSGTVHRHLPVKPCDFSGPRSVMVQCVPQNAALSWYLLKAAQAMARTPCPTYTCPHLLCLLESWKHLAVN